MDSVTRMARAAVCALIAVVTTDANVVFADWSPGVQTDLAAVSLPEPASLFLLGTGLAAAASASRRRRRAVAA